MMLTWGAGIQGPWKAIPFKQGMSRKLDSPLCLEVIKGWLARCAQEHPECNATMPQSTFPRRVICIDSGMPDTGAYLYESQGKEDGKYLALSHCWGDVVTVPKTTKGTLEQRRHGIRVETLSRTFRDAIDITRKLGFRYIWIDALCIVQDDPADWAEEAAKMSSVYAGAALTIAAAASGDGEGGCFYERRTGFGITSRSAPEACRGLRVRLPIDHTFQSDMEALYRRETSDHTEYPLMRRKWVFQERMLSSRVLYYTKDELWWECKSRVVCECGLNDSGVEGKSDHYECASVTRKLQCQSERQSRQSRCILPRLACV